MAHPLPASPHEEPEADAHLQPLQQRFLDALEARRQGDIDASAELLRGVLKVEPRLAEPRLELAQILLGAGQLDEAEEEAREALRLLEAGGQWSEDIDPGVLLSLCLSTLGQVLQEQASTDEVVFGDEQRWKELMDESRRLFRRAAELDPDNAHAEQWAFGLSPEEQAAGEEADPDAPIALIPRGGSGLPEA